MLKADDLRFLLSALLSALALHVVAHERPQGTPVDAALPLVAVVVIFLAWLARGSRFGVAVEACVPLLVAAAVTIADERLRLLAFGVIVAAAFATAAALVPRTFVHLAGLTLAGVVVLRWIPLREVELWREIVVALGAMVVLLALWRGGVSPAGWAPSRRPDVFLALAVALVTPTHPGKALLYPFVVAAIVFVARALPSAALAGAALIAAAFVARASLAPLWFVAGVAVALPLLWRARAAMPVYVAAMALFALWPWSGLVARALPRLFAAEPPSPGAQIVGRALAASESIELAVPPGTRRIVVTASGANVARMRPRRVVGSVNGRPIRIGDVADFGFLRREHFFAARNPLPRHPVADIRGYGQTAFLYGAGRIELDARGPLLRITAAPDLPARARLQVESVELRGCEKIQRGPLWIFSQTLQ